MIPPIIRISIINTALWVIILLIFRLFVHFNAIIVVIAAVIVFILSFTILAILEYLRYEK